MRTQSSALLTEMTLLCSLCISSCKTRQFGETQSITIANPDAPSQKCNAVLNPNAPYSAKEFAEKIVNAFNSGIKSKALGEENLRDFLFASDIPAVMSGSLTSEMLHLDHCNITNRINESLTKPSYFFWLTGNGTTTFGGMTFYKGDIFAEGFYRNRSEGVEGMIYPRRKYSFKEIMTQQPWFEWNKEARSFTAKIGTPAARIAEHIQAEQGASYLTLHRGTNVIYSAKAKALETRNSFAFGEYGGIFTTPSFEAAKVWANPVVLTAKLDPGEFLARATTKNSDRGNVPTVYVGIEYGYPEVAFLFAPGDKNNLFFDSVTSKCVVTKGKQGADVNFAPACK